MESLVVGSFTPSVLLDLARSTGALESGGLDVREEPVRSSPSQFQSLVDGDLDVALTSPDNVLLYRFGRRNPLGGPLDARIVGAVDRGLGLGLYARPGLAAADLRGARLGVDVPVSGFALGMYALGDSLGLPRDAYEVVTLGSTPRRLEALLAGECEATMLNAGNELVAEAAGCPRLASLTAVHAPYLGTVVAVVGEARLDPARRLAAALARTATALVAGRHLDAAAEAASRRLGLDDDLAARYVARLRDPDDGLVPDGAVDAASLATLVDLRTTYLPEPDDDGHDVLAAAHDPASGLVDGPGPRGTR